MQNVKVISIRRATHPRNGVSVYATVQSRSRGTRLNHSVVKVGRRFDCSCEDSILRQNKNCDHAKRLRKALAAS